MSKSLLAILIFLAAVCLSVAYCATKAKASGLRSPYENIEKELPSGKSLKTANIIELGNAFGVALRKYPDDAVALLRVCVLLRCRAHAVADSDIQNAPSVHPRADILHLLRIALNEYPQFANDFINDSMKACGDVAQASAKVVLTDAPKEDLPDHPWLLTTPWENPPSISFTAVTPVTDGR